MELWEARYRQTSAREADECSIWSILLQPENENGIVNSAWFQLRYHYYVYGKSCRRSPNVPSQDGITGVCVCRFYHVVGYLHITPAIFPANLVGTSWGPVWHPSSLVVGSSINRTGSGNVTEIVQD